MASGRRKADDLHGNVPDTGTAVLMIVDVINDLDFPGNTGLVRRAAPLGRTVAALKLRCRQEGIPSIYVNDNRDSDHSRVRCLRGNKVSQQRLVETKQSSGSSTATGLYRDK